MEQCNKQFRGSNELYAHLLEHPQFCGQCEEEQDELINRLTFQNEPVRLPSEKYLSMCSPE